MLYLNSPTRRKINKKKNKIISTSASSMKEKFIIALMMKPGVNADNKSTEFHQIKCLLCPIDSSEQSYALGPEEAYSMERECSSQKTWCWRALTLFTISRTRHTTTESFSTLRSAEKWKSGSGLWFRILKLLKSTEKSRSNTIHEPTTTHYSNSNKLWKKRSS